MAVDYNDGTYYYSETSGENVLIRDLPLPYVRNIAKKHSGREGFEESALFGALAERLCPPISVLWERLRATGQASYWCPSKSRETRARSKFYALARKHGVTISTHRNGEFIEGRLEDNVWPEGGLPHGEHPADYGVRIRVAR